MAVKSFESDFKLTHYRKVLLIDRLFSRPVDCFLCLRD